MMNDDGIENCRNKRELLEKSEDNSGYSSVLPKLTSNLHNISEMDFEEYAPA